MSPALSGSSSLQHVILSGTLVGILHAVGSHSSKHTGTGGCLGEWTICCLASKWIIFHWLTHSNTIIFRGVATPIIYISKKLTCLTSDTNWYGLVGLHTSSLTVTCIENPGSSVVLETMVLNKWISDQWHVHEHYLAGKLVTAKYIPEPKYYKWFPHAASAKKHLQPT